jgi:hypothetical protein
MKAGADAYPCGPTPELAPGTPNPKALHFSASPEVASSTDRLEQVNAQAHIDRAVSD